MRPPLIKPKIISNNPPKERLIPVAGIISMFFVATRVRIPPKAEQTALIINIPSPAKEMPEKKTEPLKLIIIIPLKPRMQPIILRKLSLSSAKIIDESRINKNVLKESIIALLPPLKCDKPI